MDQHAKNLLKIYAASILNKTPLSNAHRQEIHRKIGMGEFPDLYDKRYKNNPRVLAQVVNGSLIPPPAVKVPPQNKSLGSRLDDMVDDKKPYYNDTMLQMPRLEFKNHGQSFVKNLFDQAVHEARYGSNSIPSVMSDIAGKPRPKPDASPIVIRHPGVEAYRDYDRVKKATSAQVLDDINTSPAAFYNSPGAVKAGKKNYAKRVGYSAARSVAGLLTSPVTMPLSMGADQQSHQSLGIGSLVPYSKYFANSILDGYDGAMNAFNSSRKAGDNPALTAIKMYLGGRLMGDQGFLNSIGRGLRDDPVPVFLDAVSLGRSARSATSAATKKPPAKANALPVSNRAAQLSNAARTLDGYSQHPLFTKSGTLPPESFDQNGQDKTQRQKEIAGRVSNLRKFGQRRSVLPR